MNGSACHGISYSDSCPSRPFVALSYVRCPFLRSTFAATAPSSAVTELGVVRRFRARVMKPAHRSFFVRWRVPVVLIVAVTVVLSVTSWWTGPFRILQLFASDIHDSYDGSGGGITGDFKRCIRARCSEEVFHRYARQQGLSQLLSEDDPAGVMGWSSCPERWWTPPRSYRGAFYSFRDGGKRRLLAYSDGYLHYDISVR